jgi:hypothetical protein
MDRRTGIILLVTLAALGGIAYYLNLNPEVVATPTPTSGFTSPTQSPLWAFDSTQISSLTVVDTAQSLTFRAAVDDSGKWMMTEPQEAEADAARMSALASTVGSLMIARTITESNNLADFGLDAPGYAIEVKLKDGQTFRATVGDKAVTGFSYYVLPEGAQNAVVVSSGSLDTLLLLPGQPPLVTPTAPVTVEPLPLLPLPGTPSP